MRPSALLGALLLAGACTPSADLASYSSDGPGAAATLEAGAPGAFGEAESAGGSGVAPVPPDPPQPDESELPQSLEGGSLGGNAGGPPVSSAGEEPSIDEPAGEEPPTPIEPVEEEPAPPTPHPAPQFRFVRLIADSAYLGSVTSIAEFNVLGESGEPLDRSGWLVEADSEELVFAGGAPASLALDGVAISMWHTAWFEVTAPAHPHVLEVDMGDSHELSGFRYLARQDGSLDGRIGDYRLFLSTDGVDWGEPVSAGTLVNSDVEQEIRFTPRVSALAP